MELVERIMNITREAANGKPAICMIEYQRVNQKENHPRFLDSEDRKFISSSAGGVLFSELQMLDRVGQLQAISLPAGPICMIGESSDELNNVVQLLTVHFETQYQDVEIVYLESTALDVAFSALSNRDKRVIVVCNLSKTTGEDLLAVIPKCISHILLPIAYLSVRCGLNAHQFSNHYSTIIIKSLKYNKELRHHLWASLDSGECLVCYGWREYIRCFDQAKSYQLRFNQGLQRVK